MCVHQLLLTPSEDHFLEHVMFGCFTSLNDTIYYLEEALMHICGLPQVFSLASNVLYAP